jgi:hypothetical protein
MMDSEQFEPSGDKDAKTREPLGFIEFFALGVAGVVMVLCVIAALRIF